MKVGTGLFESCYSLFLKLEIFVTMSLPHLGTEPGFLNCESACLKDAASAGVRSRESDAAA